MKIFSTPQNILGLILALILALVLGQLLLAPPKRTRPDFDVPKEIQLSDHKIFAAEKEERPGANDLPIENLYRYRLAGESSAPASDWQIELICFESANASAEDFPQKYASPRIVPTDKKGPINLRPNENDGSSWLEGTMNGHRYFGTRISPNGFCTITKSELWRRRRAEWREHPAHLVAWLFSSQEIVDRRGVWLQMFADSTQPNDDGNLETRWREILAAFRPELRRSFASQNGS